MKKAAKELCDKDEAVFDELVEEGKVDKEKAEHMRAKKVTVGKGNTDIYEIVHNRDSSLEDTELKSPLESRKSYNHRSLYTSDSIRQVILYEADDYIRADEVDTIAVHRDENVEKTAKEITRAELKTIAEIEYEVDPSASKEYDYVSNMYDLANIYGVNIDELLISQPDTGEQALEICEALVRSNAVSIVVIDSVAALVPQAEIDGEMGDSHVGLQARLMSQAMRKLTAILAQTKTLCIFTNQIREKIGVMFGNPETTPGGRALKFYASVRLNIQRVGAIKDTAGNVTGNRTRVKVVKNKVAPPFVEAEFDILYNKGIWWEGSIIEAGIKQGLIVKRGSWLSYGNDQIGQGAAAAAAFLEQNPDITEKLVETMKGNVGADANAEANDEKSSK